MADPEGQPAVGGLPPGAPPHTLSMAGVKRNNDPKLIGRLYHRHDSGGGAGGGGTSPGSRGYSVGRAAKLTKRTASGMGRSQKLAPLPTATVLKDAPASHTGFSPHKVLATPASMLPAPDEDIPVPTDPEMEPAAPAPRLTKRRIPGPKALPKNAPHASLAAQRVERLRAMSLLQLVVRRLRHGTYPGPSRFSVSLPSTRAVPQSPVPPVPPSPLHSMPPPPHQTCCPPHRAPLPLPPSGLL